MLSFLKSFTVDQRGQDLIEWTLLLAFVALAAAAIFMGSHASSPAPCQVGTVCVAEPCAAGQINIPKEPCAVTPPEPANDGKE